MGTIPRFFHQYAWTILKNVLGWILILAGISLGPLVPGPNGIVLFLIGFAMVTFPGKRRLTSRVLRGRLVSPATRTYRRAVWAISLVVPLILAWWSQHYPAIERKVQQRGWSPLAAGIIVYCACALFLHGVLRLLPVVANLLLRATPRIRRKVRPKLRRIGIRLLPPRWHMPHLHPHGRMRRTDEQIIHFHESWKANLTAGWKKLRPWLPKLIGLVVVPIIFYRLLKPIVQEWDRLQPHLEEIRWDFLAVACLMFAVNQFFCRLTLWRGVLRGLGWRLPAAPAARIWTSSELARYVPGMIWQMVGRAYLAKPYGLPAGTCSISQVLELTITLLANILIAVSTLMLAGSRVSDEARPVLLFAMLLLPLLLAFLHPRVFYPVVNLILRKAGRPIIERQLSGRQMAGLLLLALAGQCWISLAIWIGTHSILQIPFADVWILAGSYSLAWTVGFCMASIAPAGIGVREWVLSITLFLVIPPSLSHNMDAATRLAFFKCIALVLRLWATTGELIFAVIAYLWDWRGVRGEITAPATQV